MIPIRVAQLLSIWPPGSDVDKSKFETAGDPLKVWIAPRRCTVKVLTPDYESPEVEADLVISPLTDEVLLNDKLISWLQIAL